MGRKALLKKRKQLTPKAEQWIRDLFPKVQDEKLSDLTLDKLAMLMGKSKSTIYSYFTTKEEIFSTMVRQILSQLEETIDTSLVDQDDMVVAYYHIFTKLGEGLQGLSIQFVDEIKTCFPLVWDMVQEFVEKLLRVFKSIYEQGMSSGRFRRYNIELLMAMDHHFVVAIMTDKQLFEGAKLTLNDLVMQYLELRIRALQPRVIFDSIAKNYN